MWTQYEARYRHERIMIVKIRDANLALMISNIPDEDGIFSLVIKSRAFHLSFYCSWFRFQNRKIEFGKIDKKWTRCHKEWIKEKSLAAYIIKPWFQSQTEQVYWCWKRFRDEKDWETFEIGQKISKKANPEFTNPQAMGESSISTEVPIPTRKMKMRQ